MDKVTTLKTTKDTADQITDSHNSIRDLDSYKVIKDTVDHNQTIMALEGEELIAYLDLDLFILQVKYQINLKDHIHGHIHNQLYQIGTFPNWIIIEDRFRKQNSVTKSLNFQILNFSKSFINKVTGDRIFYLDSNLAGEKFEVFRNTELKLWAAEGISFILK